MEQLQASLSQRDLQERANASTMSLTFSKYDPRAESSERVIADVSVLDYTSDARAQLLSEHHKSRI